MKYNPLALAAAALMAGFLSFGGAQAANLMTGTGAPQGIAKMQDTNIQPVSHRRHWRWRRHRGITLGFGFPFFFRPYQPYYYSEPYYYRPYRRVGSRHVRWCLNHYISYNPRTDTFMGFDGYRHRCRSPYRY